MATVLGISPGSRAMGIAILRNGNLIEARVKTFAGTWSKEKLERIVSEIKFLAIKHGVTVIALKVNHPSRTSNWLLQLSKRIEKLAKVNAIDLRIYSIEKLESSYLLGRKPTAIGMLAKLAKEYPETGYAHENGKHNRHYLKMFEAIAAAKYAAGGRN